MASTFILKRKTYSRGFDPATYTGMVNAAATNSTSDAQKMLDGYSKKYSTEIANYKNSTALVPTTPKTNIQTPTTPKTNIQIPTTPKTDFRSYKKGWVKGTKNTGVMQGMKNTWGRMGTMGKAGIVTGAAAGGYFLGKGLGLWGNNKEK